MAVVKVWNHDKSRGYLLNIAKFEDLAAKAKEKFDVDPLSHIKFVLEDGIQVDEDGFAAIADETVLNMLLPGQDLNLPSTSGSTGNESRTEIITEGAQRPPVSEDSQRSLNLLDLVKKFRQKQTSLYQNQKTSKRRKLTFKINIGWLVWNRTENKYLQVKLRTGGGSQELEVPGDSDYQSLLQIGKDLFFPHGICEKRGPVASFNHALGDFKQNIISEEDFTIEGYALKHKLSTRPRLYLMSKKKAENDMDLPDLNFNTIEIPSSPPEITLIESDLLQEDDLDSNTTTQTSVRADHSYESPVVCHMTSSWPRIPVCNICTDRYSNGFLDCGHICCMVCATELQERGGACHVCRLQFTDIKRLF